MAPRSFYVAEGGGRFASTELTRGPWSPAHQHAGPPSALLARAMERASAIPHGQTGRLTVDILRPIPIAPLEVGVRTLRLGRSVEQLEATLLADGVTVARASAWRLRRAAGAPASPVEPPPPSGGDAGADLAAWWRDEVAYHRAFEWRLASGTLEAPGPACVWARQTAELVAGEPASPFERLVAMADAASGVSWAMPWDEYLFPNLDVSVHLERPPTGEWTAMDAVTRVGPEGAGQCTAVLFDARGRVGISTQTLLVRPR